MNTFLGIVIVVEVALATLLLLSKATDHKEQIMGRLQDAASQLSTDLTELSDRIRSGDTESDDVADQLAAMSAQVDALAADGDDTPASADAGAGVGVTADASLPEAGLGGGTPTDETQS